MIYSMMSKKKFRIKIELYKFDFKLFVKIRDL